MGGRDRIVCAEMLESAAKRVSARQKDRQEQILRKVIYERGA